MVAQRITYQRKAIDRVSLVIVGLGVFMGPMPAHAARHGIIEITMREYPALLPIFFGLMILFLFYAAFSNADWAFDSTYANVIEKIVGRTGLRIFFGLGGLGLLVLCSQLLNEYSNDLEKLKPIRCGGAGTQSFITDEGICDCMPGYTWADEDDETSVVCMLE